MSRQFHQMLFHGNGEDSEIKFHELVYRLDEGHMWLGGMQQGVPTDSEEYKKGEEEIKDICRDILASFGFSDEGLEWKKLPYPNNEHDS